MRGISFIIAVEVIKGISSSPHDPVKFFEVKHTVTISVGLLKHFLELIIRNLLSDFAGDSLEVLEGDLVEIVLIEELEDLEDLFLAELSVDVPHVLFLDLHSKSLHDGLELSRIDFP